MEDSSNGKLILSNQNQENEVEGKLFFQKENLKGQIHSRHEDHKDHNFGDHEKNFNNPSQQKVKKEMSILHDACSKSKINRGSSAEQVLQPMQEIFLEQKSEPVHEPAKFPVMLKTTANSIKIQSSEISPLLKPYNGLPPVVISDEIIPKTSTYCKFCYICDKAFDFQSRNELKDHMKQFHGNNSLVIQEGQNLSLYKIEGQSKINLGNRKKEITNKKVHEGLKKKVGRPKRVYEGPKKKQGRPRNSLPITKCEICSQDFASSQSLRRHEEIVHEEPKCFKCEHCDKSYNMIQTLKSHVNSVHLGQWFECQFCKKSYSKIPHLKRHLELVHEERKDFKCFICGKFFGSKSHGKRHVIVVHKLFDQHHGRKNNYK